tara:strand:+ start:1343 stop:1519 length:177 start_codon:yes stop_codon:yes gene_type:complete
MSSKTVIFITWHPTRTEPTEVAATMQVDYSDGSQDILVAETDVSSKLQLVQDAYNALF